MFFISKQGLVEVVKEALGIKKDGDSQVEMLKKQVVTLKEEIAELTLKKTMSEREVEQLVKMKQEKQDIEYSKKEIELKGKFQDKEMGLMKDFHNKTLELLETGRKEMREIHTEILQRLPNINMEISKDIKRKE